MQTQHVFGRLNSDSTDKDMGPEEYRDSKHLMTANDAYSKGFRREITKGNEAIQNVPGLSINAKCIGTHEDRINNRVIYFIKDPINSISSGIYQLKNGLVDKILDNNGFDFDINKTITQISFTDQYMFFIDTNNVQYYIDTKRALETNELNGIDAKYLKLLKPRPSLIPSASFQNTPTLGENRICFDNYKFFFRFTYKDNTKTVVSNASKLMIAQLIPDLGELDNTILVSTTIDNELKKVLSKITFFYEKNDGGIFYEFNTQKITNANSYSARYTGYETTTPLNSIDSIKVNEAVPVKSNAGAVVKSINFINSFSNDYDDDGDYDFTLTPNSTSVTDIELSFGLNPFTFKRNGSYSVGIAFYDEEERLSPILKKKVVKIPNSAIGVLNRIQVSVTGNMPSWAKSYQMYITEDSNYSAYFQCFANKLFYLADFQEGETVGANEFVYNGAIYKSEEIQDTDQFSFLHWQLPINIPFLPDGESFLRLVSVNGLTDVVEPIVDVRGDIIVTETFGLDNGVDLKNNLPLDSYFIEIFKNEPESDNLYFAYPEKYQINGVENRQITLIDSDTYLVPNRNVFRPLVEDINQNLSVYDINDFTYLLRDSFPTESPSRTIQSVKESTLNTATIKKSYPEYDDSVEKIFPRGSSASTGQRIANVLVFTPLAPIALIGSLINRKRRIKDEKSRTLEIERTTTFNSGVVLDYLKSTNGWGFPNVFFEQYRRTNQSTVFYFSDPYVQNSNINGIGSFDQGNRIELPIERGNVTCLFPTDIDSSTVLLAFHDRNVTSIYVGESFVRQNQDSILTKTDGVIGDERILIGGYGTVNPESVVIHSGRVYFWDLRAGEPIRYSRAGLTPLGTTYKLRKEFNKWQKILQNFPTEEYKVNGGFDPLNDLFYLSFPTVGENKGETYVFSETDQNEGWVTKLEIEPDIFAKNNNDLYSFKNGQIYIHNADVRATFYGEVKESSITFVHNEMSSSEKIYENIIINSNAPWNVDVKNRRGQETDLVNNELEHRDETFYGEFLRDKNTPLDQLNNGEVPLLHGSLIKDQLATVTLSITSEDNIYLDDVGVGFTMVAGHNNKAKK